MAQSIASLSGWGQAHDALASIAPEALAIDYARHSSAQAALLDIAAQAKSQEVIIGWSLGGQLAVRAIASGMLSPRFLILISTPFQFVATEENLLGMKRALYDKFRDNYARNPERTLHKAWELIVKGDTRADQVRDELERYDKEEVMTKNWLQWLDTMNGFSCESLSFADFPPTLLLHGDQDAVVDISQSQRFMQAIPGAGLITFAGCGHAPHWHDADLVRYAIKEFSHV